MTDVSDGVLRFNSKTERPEEERETLAYLDDYALTIPKRFSAAFALRYVRMASRHGIDAAADFLLEEALGVEGYERLLAFEDLEPEQLGQIMAILQSKVVGAAESPKGKRSRPA